ncbi:MAG: hypothetical protein JNK82_14220 [Myxococcaceae bacterium]|nr:hypothetical protein [Myxococcaceae bacterium]
MSRLLPLALLAACAPQPTPLKAGLATVALDAPIGTSLGGYNRSKPSTDRGSRWALNFAASTGTLGNAPTARALALDDGTTRVAVVRIDTALVTATLQSRTEALLEPGVKLVLAATHTHAGPARFFRRALTSGGSDITAIAMDVYDPELEERMAASIAESVRQAFMQLTPVAVGHGEADASSLNRDRRCQNDALYGEGYRDGKVRVVRFDAVDATGTPTRPIAALLNYAAHGVLLGDGNTLMSAEVTGALEEAGGALTGVPLLYLQGAAGDVSPTAGPHQGPQALDAYGQAGAPLIKVAFDAAAPQANGAPRQRLQHTRRGVSTKRADCGYARGDFPEFGAVGCGLAGSACEQQLDPKDIICLPLTRTGVVSTPVTALRIDGVLLVTLPGEPTTALGDRVREAAMTVEGVEQTLVVGYAGDHGGYLLEEADFLRGGYEPSVSPWGWKFGDHLVREVKAMLSTLGSGQPAFEALTPEAVTVRRPIDESPTAPAVLESPPASLERLSTAVFRFSGGDPTLGTPRVTLEREENGVFAPPPTEPLVLRVRQTPSVAEEPGATTRAHEYTVQWETLPTTPPGRYRLTAAGTARRAGETTTYRLESAPFEVTASSQAGVLASAGVTAAGQLAVKLRFAANPVRYGSPDDPVGNYRLRDFGSTAADGALARGGAATARLTGPDGVATTSALVWSETAEALVLELPQATGRWVVEVAPRAFTDGAGNTNGASVHLELNR